MLPVQAPDTEKRAKITLGAIRWDAWTAHDGVPDSVISQVERSLSPARFHWRAPFFAEVSKEGKILIPAYTQEIFDTEMAYAIEAGIDYFAYVWYSDAMKAAREFHTASRYKNAVKLCACLDGNAIGKEFTHRELEQLFSKEYYMTVQNNRPLMYYFASSKTLALIAEDIRYYREAAKRAGVGAPYAVIMNKPPETARAVCADAVSAYAIEGEQNNPFSAVASRARARWEEWQSSGMPYVPTVSFGWNPEPRYVNPVSWMTVENNTWAAPASADEIRAHLLSALSYMAQPAVAKQTEASTLIAYAWNEHDEGGWLCPTLAVDENGNPLYQKDGTKIINAERIAAVRAALTEFGKGK